MSGASALRLAMRVPADEPCGSLRMELCGVEVVLRPSGALWLPGSRVLVVADLHLEKGSAYAARGQLLPPFDTAETLGRLEAELANLRPATLVLLGDSFHDRGAMGRIARPDALRIEALGLGRTLVWVVGNHDAEALAVGPDGLGRLLPGDVAGEVRLAPLTLRHEPLAGVARGDVAGHLHPCVKVVRRGRSVRRRAFLTDGHRLILPAFGAYAGGLNACDPAFLGLFTEIPIAAALGDRRVHPLSFEVLSPD